MAQLNLDAARIEESFGPLQAVANANIVDLIDQLAAVLKPQAGTNEIADELIGLCKKVQDNYNAGFLETLNSTITEYKKVIDISEYMSKRASVGTVSSVDTGVKTDSIDPDAVMI